MAHKAGPNVPAVAVTAAVLAAVTAISSLRAGYHANAAMLDQMRSADAWALFQAKTIKADLIATRAELLRAEGVKAEDQTKEALAKYQTEQETIAADARREQKLAGEHMERHESYARAVTTFQVAIALCAISVLASRSWIFRVSIGLGLVGLGLVVRGAI